MFGFVCVGVLGKGLGGWWGVCSKEMDPPGSAGSCALVQQDS